MGDLRVCPLLPKKPKILDKTFPKKIAPIIILSYLREIRILLLNNNN